MSWFRIEGKMPQHEKYAPLSDAAFRLAITAGAWCSENMTDGMIRKTIVPTLTRAPSGKKLSCAIESLVSAGIWEDHGDSYEIHDYLDWNLSKAQWLSKVAAGAAGGRAKAANSNSNQLAPARATDLADARQKPEQTASTTPSAPLADSDTERSNLITYSKEPGRFSRDTDRSEAEEVHISKVPCPVDLKLTDDQEAVLETSLIPRWAIGLMTTQFVSKAVVNRGDTRPLDAWRKCLSVAITRDWQSGKRPKKPEPEQKLGTNGKPIMSAKEAGLPGA
jgi:hypothetical protein